jgi:uncharacterized membrane protein YgcG
MRIAWRAILALFVIAAPAAAQADERILHYSSDVTIQPDASLEVTETIDIRAERNAINHGIFRDFPTRYRGTHGSQVRVGFTFGGATLDGQPVEASTSPVSNGIRIKIGDPDSFVEIGEHRYVIRYRTTRQIGRFEGYDELYWNATGNGWAFPIDVAEARIRLPQPVKLGQHAVYTGRQGSTDKFAEVVEETPGEIAFRTTRPLGPSEGLTIAVAFPKGVVADVGESTHLAWWLSDYGPPAVGLGALAGLLAYYFTAWKRAGRDPRAGTIVPIFSPPDDLSPAAMRYIVKMGSDNRVFAAALVDMGVRGHIKLSEEDGGFFSKDKTRLERLAASAPLPAEEEEALRKLALSGESIMMVQKNHEKFSSAQNSLAEALKEQFEGRLFNKNWGWAIAGIVLLVAAVWIAAAAVVASYGLSDLMMVGTSIGLFALAAVLILLIHQFRSTGKCLLTILAFIVGATALALGAPMIPLALESGWWLPVALPLLSLPLVVSAFAWIDAPTVEGRGVLDRIAGFKQYLSITERERLDRMNPPEDTPELFERYLPYAIALGVENRWADRFAGVLAAAAAQGRQGFAWYAGSSDPWSNTGRFTETVGSSLASTISSASAAPGSSSGSGGGGSSGGGGGGGGGGGW